jgi:hypothetical protein
MTRQRWRRGDRGASAIDYAAIVMVGTLILWALIYVAIPDHVMRRLPPELCRIFGGDCQAQQPQSDEDFRPRVCERSSEQQRYGAVIKVAVVRIGDEYSFLRQEMADGSVRLTVVPTNWELGLEVGAGGKLNLGRNLRLGADVTVAGSISVGVGDTYVFEDAEEADEFEDEIREISYRDAARDLAQGGSPILNNPIGDWALDRVDDATGRPDIKDPEITTTTISYQAGVEGTLGLYLPVPGTSGDGSDDWDFNLNTGITVAGERGGEIVVTQDNRDPDNPRTSYFIGVSGTISGSAEVLGAGGQGELTWSGGQRLTFDEEGRLVAVTYTTTFEKGGQWQGRIGGNHGDTSGGGSGQAGEKTVETVTMTVPIDNAADRAAMTEFLATNPQQMPLNLLRYMTGEDNVIQTDPGPNANVLDRLMYEQGTVLKQQAESETDGWEIGAEAKLGLVLGASISNEGSTTDTTGAEYLGAPVNGRREWVPYPECVN